VHAFVRLIGELTFGHVESMNQSPVNTVSDNN